MKQHQEFRQGVFDRITDHLTRQGESCVGSDGFKRYAYDGRYSAIGCHLRFYEPAYLSQIEGLDPEDVSLTQRCRDLLLALENVHDYYPVEQWNGQFHAVAKEFGLTYKGVPYGEMDKPERIPKMLEYTYSLEFKVRLPDGVPVTDEALAQAVILAANGEGRPSMTQQATLERTFLVEKIPYALTIDVRLPNNHNLVSLVGTLAYDEYDAVSTLRENLGHPEASDLSIIKVEAIPAEAFGVLQRIDA